VTSLHSTYCSTKCRYRSVLDIYNQINVDKSSTRLAHTLGIVSSKEVLPLDQNIRDWIKSNAPAIKGATSSSPTPMFPNIGQRNNRSMLFGTSVALAAISIVLIVALRSFKIGIISVILTLLPAAVGFGLWGIFVGQVGMTLSLATGMSFGIVVDNTVHFLSKYLRAKREKNLPPEDAVRYAFHTVGNALIITTSTLIIGFLALATSSFSLNADMGLLTAVVIAVALAAVFLPLPPLSLKIKEKNSAASPGAPSTGTLTAG
jgi:predicted RND superfamily exporter protein